MAALSADVHMPYKGSPTKANVQANAADIFYAGALVAIDADNGYAIVASQAAGDRIVGISTHKQTTTAQGDPVEVWIDGTFLIPVGSVARADIRGVVVMVDSAFTDNPADLVIEADVTLGANDALIGRGFELDSGGSTWVRLDLGWIYSATLGWV